MKAEFQQDIMQQNILLQEITRELKTKNQTYEKSSKILENRHQHYAILLKELQKDKHVLMSNLNKARFNKKFETLSLVAISVTVIVFSTSMMDNYSMASDQNIATGNYLVENLRGDIQQTWKVWNVPVDSELVVNVANPDMLTGQQKLIIHEVILSKESHDIDNSLLHKGAKGTYSKHYVGWLGALDDASKSDSKFNIPANIRIIESNKHEGDILIQFTTLRNEDGYSGFTKSIVDGNQILKSNIMIYDIDSISNTQLATILRHEFGHALGLGHSTAPEDLMAPTIETDFPFISPCNVAAITALYNGQTTDEVTCKI